MEKKTKRKWRKGPTTPRWLVECVSFSLRRFLALVEWPHLESGSGV